jgi:hypothetical protein
LSRPPIPAEVRSALRAPYSTTDRRRAIGDFVADIPLEPGHPSRPALDHIAAGLTELATVPTLRQGVRGTLSSRRPRFATCSGGCRRGCAAVPRASHLVVEDAPQSGRGCLVG